MVLETRLSPDYLPQKKQTQDLMYPTSDKLLYDNPIVAIASYGVEFFFIFADGNKSDFWTTRDISTFKEHRLDANTSVRTIKINYRNEKSSFPGRMDGIELIDWNNKSVLKAGDWQ